MVLTQAGLDYICEKFGNELYCCTRTGLSWFYTISGTTTFETGGTAQIVSRLASGLVDSLTMTSPARGTFTKADLDAANDGLSVTLEDAKTITFHDEPTEDQWCYGAKPPGDKGLLGILLGTIVVGAGAFMLSKK